VIHNKELCKITTTPQFSYVGSVSTVTTEEQNCLNFLKPFVYMPGTLNEEDTYINPIVMNNAAFRTILIYSTE
jgi:hypothetical protein